MALVRKVTVDVKAQTAAAQAKLDAISAEARKLSELNPEIAPKLETAAFTAKLAVLKHELKDAGSGADVTGGQFGVLGRAFSGIGGAVAGILPALASSASLLGAVAVAGAGLVIALAPLGAALAVIGVGVAGFAAIAVPMISKVITARTALAAAEKKYDEATTKAQRAAALKAEAAATDGLTSAQKSLLGPMDQIAGQFHKLTAAVQPYVVRAFSSALRIIKDLMPALTPLVVAAGKALDKLLSNMAGWLESPSGKKFLKWLEVAGPKDIANFGKDLWTFAQDAGKAFKWMVDAGTSLDKRLAERWRDVRVVSQDLRNWIWRDFVQKISNFFTNTIPSAAALLRDELHLKFDQIAIAALGLVLKITVAFGHLPGAMGAPFRRASANIRTELGHMADDVKNTVAKINDDWASLHGGKVLVQFRFPPGTIGRLHQLHPGGFASGTTGAAPGWAWTGEQGPELVHFRGGETVLSHQLSRRVAGYAAGTPGFTDAVPSFPAINRVFAAVQGVIDRVIAGLQRAWGHIPAPPGFYVPGGGGSGVQRWAGLVAQVLSMLGQPGWTQPVAMRQMQTESGGNPLAVNRTDSNWLAGHPSVGLMQVIAGTFASYAGRFRGTGPFEYGVSVNPLANIFAGLNYAVHRYGAGWTRVLGQGHGYDSGGWLAPGWNPPMYNGTGRPEHLVPSGRGAPPVKVVLEVRARPGADDLERAIIGIINKHVFVMGGDVQTAFGHG